MLIPALFGLAAAALIHDLWRDDDAPAEEAPPEGELQPPGAGDDTLDLAPDFRGILDAGAGDDTLRVTVEGAAMHSITEGSDYYWDTPSGDPAAEINAGPGDDVLWLSGGGYAVQTGAGNDLVHMGDAQDVLIRADAGDTVMGQDAADVPDGQSSAVVLLDGAATFTGGSAGESVYAYGAGAVVAGHGGDDLLYGMEDGAAAFYGGAGNDTLFGSRDVYGGAEDWGRSHPHFAISHDVDTLDGGAGDDAILGSHGELITGGAGNDGFALRLGHGEAAEIADFDPSRESLSITWGTHVPGTADTPDAEWPLLVSPSEISVATTPAGDSVILGRGEPLVILRGVTEGLRIGFADAEGRVTDALGTPLAEGEWNLRLDRATVTIPA